MSWTIKLAADFIEKMANPAYGIHTNEEYALRFAELLESEDFSVQLAKEAKRLYDPSTLSAHGWLWMLRWARSNRILLNEKLLLRLAESWSSVTMQIATISAAIHDEKSKENNQASTTDRDLHPYLRALVDRCTRIDSVDEALPREEIKPDKAERLLVALMQVGSPHSIAAATELLNRHWAGQNTLNLYFDGLCEQVDEDTREEWLSRMPRQ